MPFAWMYNRFHGTFWCKCITVLMVHYSDTWLPVIYRSNLSLSPEESWLPLTSIIFCIIHIQVQVYQLFSMAGSDSKNLFGVTCITFLYSLNNYSNANLCFPSFGRPLYREHLKYNWHACLYMKTPVGLKCFHWQLEASIRNGDLQGFQLFSKTSEHLSSMTKKRESKLKEHQGMSEEV